MLLKEKYYLNHLIKQKRFMLLDPFVFSQYRPTFNFKEIKDQKNNLYPLNKKRNLYPSKNQRVNGNTLKTLNSLLNINKYSFLENHQRFKYKQVRTYFRNIISDQKKRRAFAKDELKKTIFKTLLSANQKTFVFTRKMFFNGLEIPAFKSLPPTFQKVTLKGILQFSLQETHTKNRLLKTNSIFEQNAFRINQNSSSRYARLGPILFLEKTINPLFTGKIKSFSRIRNRCLLSGRSSIVGKYRLSRICFRHYVNCGLIPGLTKNRK